MLREPVTQKVKKTFAVFTTDREFEADQYKRVNKQIDTQIRALVSSRSSNDLFFSDYNKMKRPISGLQRTARTNKNAPIVANMRTL